MTFVHIPPSVGFVGLIPGGLPVKQRCFKGTYELEKYYFLDLVLTSKLRNSITSGQV